LYAQGLGAGLPLLEGLLLSGQAHPFQLYCALCSVLGGLGLLTEKLTPPSPNPYQHEELSLTFEKIKNQIDTIVNVVINEKVSQISCKKENDIFSIDVIKDYKINNSFLFGFKKKQSCSEPDFLAWINNVIICDAKKVEITQQNRTLGLQRQVLERTEDILPAKGIYLVQVNPENTKEELTTLTIFNLDSHTNSAEDIFVFIKK
jgi:type VI secretion system protein ImpJ